MTLRPARSRQRGIATNEIGIASVILLVVGVFLIRGCAIRGEPALKCLGTLAAAADGKLAADSTCPVSKAAVVVARKEGRETLTCPDPKTHLLFAPRYERETGGAWRLEQSLPPLSPGGDLEIGRPASYITASLKGTTPVVGIRPRFWWRWLVGPLVQILALVYVVSLPFQLHPKSGNPQGVMVVSVVAALVSAWSLWVTVPRVEGSQWFEFDAAQRRVIHRRFVFGVERAPVVYDSSDGVCFVRSATGWLSKGSLVLFHRSAGGRIVTELIDDLDDRDSALGAWVKARFAPAR